MEIQQITDKIITLHNLKKKNMIDMGVGTMETKMLLDSWIYDIINKLK